MRRASRLLRPPDLGDIDANRAARTQHWMLLTTVVTSTLLLSTAPLFRALPLQSVFVYAGVAAVSWLAFGLLHAGRARIAGIIFSLGLWILGAGAELLYGIASSSMILHMMTIVFTGFFWSARATNAMVVASVLWLGLIAYLQTNQLLPEPATAPIHRIWFSVSASFAVVAAVMQLAFKGLDDALTEARRSADEARQSNAALEVSVAEQLRSEEAELRLRRELEEARRLEALGRLAGGVAHDFNNLLTIMLTNVALMRRRCPLADDQELVEVEQACRQASALTRQLLAVGGRQMREARVFQLKEVVAELEGLLRRLLPENVSLTLRFADEVPPVLADEAQLEQVLVNLVANARDAMPDGGELKIEIDVLDVPEEGGKGGAIGPKPGRYARLTVIDTGQGMDEETRHSVFEPFFTTKHMGQGTGLGLATVHGIVTQSGGHVWVDSELGRGSRFVVILPATDAKAIPSREAARRHASRVPASVQSGVVLLVEDEPTVRAVLKRVLREAGFEVHSVGSTEEAIAAHAGMSELDLLVTDIVMPGMPGTELARTLRYERPELPVLLVSGYAADALPEGPHLPGTAFLHKPFSIEALRTAIEGLLN